MSDHARNRHSSKTKTSERYGLLPSVAMYEGESYDRLLNAAMSKWWGWLSPISYGLAVFNWLSHLSIAPAKQADIAKKSAENFTQFLLSGLQYAGRRSSIPGLDCKIKDHRFSHPLWNEYPFYFYSKTFLFWEKLLDGATTDVRGVTQHHLELVNFVSRQLLDIIAPSNFPWTNPEVIKATMEQGGANLVNGFQNFIEDWTRILTKNPPAGTEKFEVGKNLAITPGKVIYRNQLIELIQYEPMTTEVYQEPILITPAWIMKYYILDLSEHNSLVKYLLQKGHTVFMISWKNPSQEDRNLGLEDYVNLGILSALDVINKIIPDTKVNTVGYCIGGTLLMIAAAYMAAKSDDRLNSITLFAGQVDFKEAGELSLFIDESQITYLEDIMWEKGYLDGSQMAGGFNMLRSTELIWSRLVRDYLLGEREDIFDLLAWDYDTTRLPYRMHSEYLRKLFLNNQLVQGKFSIFGKRIALVDINTPIFAVSTVTDHIAPWRSVYKIHLYTKTDITFVLTTGGHNAGIVNEPTRSKRKFQMMTRKKGDKHITSETWQERAPNYEGSWWPQWQNWLVGLSQGLESIPSMGNSASGFPILCDAPGTYVFQK